MWAGAGEAAEEPWPLPCLLQLVSWPPAWLLLCGRERSPGALPHQQQLCPPLSAFRCPRGSVSQRPCPHVSFPHAGQTFGSRRGWRWLGSLVQLKLIQLHLETLWELILRLSLLYPTGPLSSSQTHGHCAGSASSPR